MTKRDVKIKLKNFFAIFLIPLIVAVTGGLLVLYIYYGKPKQPDILKKETETIINQDSVPYNNSENITSSPPKPREKEIIKRVTETGTGSHYYEDKAIEKAKENAVNNLKSNYGLTDTQIMNREFSISKIDSLQDNIRVTVKVSANIKK